jgi:hypothetical protein
MSKINGIGRGARVVVKINGQIRLGWVEMVFEKMSTRNHPLRVSVLIDAASPYSYDFAPSRVKLA